MKTKLEMAHDYLRDIVSNWEYDDSFDPVAEAWQYADAMQAEADKREKEEVDKQSAELRNILNLSKFKPLELQPDLKEWQPDWSQAPEWANWWAMDGDKKTRWIYSELEQPYTSDTFLRWFALGRFDSEEAPSFGYTGDWRESLRKRPK